MRLKPSACNCAAVPPNSSPRSSIHRRRFPSDHSCPTGDPQRTIRLQAEFVSAIGRMRTVFNDNEAPITDPPASAIVHPADELADWVFQTGKTTLANKVFALGTVGSQASINPGLPDEFIPFQSSRALKQTVALGSVEEWTLYNMPAPKSADRRMGRGKSPPRSSTG